MSQGAHSCWSLGDTALVTSFLCFGHCVPVLIEASASRAFSSLQSFHSIVIRGGEEGQIQAETTTRGPPNETKFVFGVLSAEKRQTTGLKSRNLVPSLRVANPAQVLGSAPRFLVCKYGHVIFIHTVLMRIILRPRSLLLSTREVHLPLVEREVALRNCCDVQALCTEIFL